MLGEDGTQAACAGVGLELEWSCEIGRTSQNRSGSQPFFELFKRGLFGDCAYPFGIFMRERS